MNASGWATLGDAHEQKLLKQTPFLFPRTGVFDSIGKRTKKLLQEPASFRDNVPIEYVKCDFTSPVTRLKGPSKRPMSTC